MYAFRADDEMAATVGVFTGSSDTDADWALSIESVRAMDDVALAQRAPLVCIMVVGPESPRPPPLWRKRMAEGQNAVRSPFYYFALVAPSALIRGVFTAINWMVKPKFIAHRARATSTFAEATHWVRHSTGTAYPSLERLYGEALLAPVSGSRIVVARRSAS
jgi:hypothetical protein